MFSQKTMTCSGAKNMRDIQSTTFSQPLQLCGQCVVDYITKVNQ